MVDPTSRAPASVPPPIGKSPFDDPLEGDPLSPRRRSEHPTAYETIAFVEGARVLTITWLPPPPDAA